MAGLDPSFFRLENWASGRRKRLALIKVKDSLDATLRPGLRFSDHQTTVYRSFHFSWWMGAREVVNARLRWTPAEQQLWRGKKEEPVSHLLREGPACPRARPHKLPGWESPYRRSNRAATSYEWCQVGGPVSRPSLCRSFFFNTLLSHHQVKLQIQCKCVYIHIPLD